MEMIGSLCWVSVTPVICVDNGVYDKKGLISIIPILLYVGLL